MARRGRSVRVDTGIYRDATGYRVVATRGDAYREKRFALSLTLRELRDERVALQTELRKARLVFTGSRGTFAGDVRRYLPQVKHLVSYKSRRAELQAWNLALGGLESRARLDRLKVKTIVSEWLQAGVAPKTVKNRLGALAALWRAMDGDDAVPPTAGVHVDIPETQPLTVAPGVVIAVAASLALQEVPRLDTNDRGVLRDAKTRGRFMVLAAMAIRPAQLKRILPVQLDLARRVLTLPGAKGGQPVRYPLNGDMVAAWTVFVQAKAWGWFDTRSFARVLRTAGWPAGIRPYNVRHSLGQDLVEAGEHYEDVKDWLGHKSVTTTKRFYAPTQSGRLHALSARLDGRLGWGVPSPVPSPPGTSAKKTEQIRTTPARRRTTKKAASRKKRP